MRHENKGCKLLFMLNLYIPETINLHQLQKSLPLKQKSPVIKATKVCSNFLDLPKRIILAQRKHVVSKIFTLQSKCRKLSEASQESSRSA